jgi:hypothetical protein
MDFVGFDVLHSDHVLVPNDGNSCVNISALLCSGLPRDGKLTIVFLNIRYVSLTMTADVPRLALPAILDPELKKASDCN